MRITYDIHFRKFKDASENTDCGFYDTLTQRKRTAIHINRNEKTIEQILTLYHEMTHAVLDLLANYKLDPKHKAPVKRNAALLRMWNEQDRNTGQEEKVCRMVEKAVRSVLKRTVPKAFYQEFFEEK